MRRIWYFEPVLPGSFLFGTAEGNGLESSNRLHSQRTNELARREKQPERIRTDNDRKRSDERAKTLVGNAMIGWTRRRSLAPQRCRTRNATASSLPATTNGGFVGARSQAHQKMTCCQRGAAGTPADGGRPDAVLPPGGPARRARGAAAGRANTTLFCFGFK